jgi:hypothetical protein
MRKRNKIIIAVAIGILIFFLLLNGFFILFGRKIICRQVERSLGLKTNFEGISFALPLSISVRNLRLGDLFSAETVSVSPSIAGFLAGKIILNEVRLSGPKFTLVKGPDGGLALPQFKSDKPSGRQPQLFLLGLKIRDGKLTFIDKQIDPAGHTVKMENISVDIAKRIFPPTSRYVNFRLSLNLLDTTGRPTGEARAWGWVDFGPKDMQGKLQIKDMDVTTLLPYCQGFISSRKLAAARLNFNAEPQAKDNDLIIPCSIVVDRIAYEKEEGTIDLAGKTIEIFSDDTGKVTFNFTLRTKLDKPYIDPKSLKAIFAQAALNNLANQDPASLYKKVKDTAEEFEDLGKTFKKIFKGGD